TSPIILYATPPVKSFFSSPLLSFPKNMVPLAPFLDCQHQRLLHWCQGEELISPKKRLFHQLPFLTHLHRGRLIGLVRMDSNTNEMDNNKTRPYAKIIAAALCLLLML